MSFFNNSSNPPAGGLFGNTGGGATGSTGTPNLYGGPAKLATGGLFGGASTITPAAGTGGLFGSGAVSSTPTATAGSLFGGGAAGSNPLLGGAATNTSTSAGTSSTPSTNPLFGSLNLTKPSDASSTAAKPALNFFGQPSTTAAAGSTTTAPTGGLFSTLPAKPAESSTAAPTGGLFGPKPASSAPAFSLGGTTTTAAPAFTLGGTSNAAPSTGGLFGTKPAEKKDGAVTPAPTFNLFGGAKVEEKKDASAVPVVKATEGSTTSTNNSTATSSAVVVSVPPPSMLRGKTIEEIVNRWTTDLETHVKDFSRFAGEVAVWDRALIENGNNLASLYSHVLTAERQQADIDQSLDNIEQQQRDLMATLDVYEKASREILGSQGGSARALDTGPADTERDRNYMLASTLHTNLDDLSTSLTQMIDSVNALSIAQKPSNEGGDDPMTQISQVLSSHLESLQWIDSAVRDVGSKVGEVEKRVKESGQSYSNGNRQRGFGLNR